MSQVAIATPSVKEVQNNAHAIRPSNFMPSEFAYGRYSAKLPLGHTVEDALKPEYWVHMAGELSADPLSGRMDMSGSIIELRSENHDFYAVLYVRAVQ